MGPRRLYLFSGYFSVVIGIIASMSAYKPQLLFYGIGLSILGFICAGTNIVLNAKYEYEGEGFPRGYWGMFFNSLPVVFLLVMVKLRS